MVGSPLSPFRAEPMGELRSRAEREKGRASLRGKEMRREGGSEESEEKSRKMVPLASSLLCELREREGADCDLFSLFVMEHESWKMLAV